MSKTKLTKKVKKKKKMVIIVTYMLVTWHVVLLSNEQSQVTLLRILDPKKVTLKSSGTVQEICLTLQCVL